MQTSLDFSLSTDFKDVGSAKPERGHQPCESRVSYPCFTRHGGALFLPSGIRNLPEAVNEYEKRLGKISGPLFSFGKGVSSPCGGRAKRRQCPSAGKSCVSAVMPRAARIGEPNRPGRNMNQQRPTHGFRQRRCASSARRARNNRKIRPEICPNMGAARNFLNFSKNFRFRCNEPAQNIVYIIYGHYFAPRNAPRAEPSCVRTRKIRIRSRASPSIYANLRTVSSKYVPKCAKPRRIPIKTVPICSLCPRSFPTGALMSRLCIKYALGAHLRISVPTCSE